MAIVVPQPPCALRDAIPLEPGDGAYTGSAMK
jgi:hypothetical protein